MCKLFITVETCYLILDNSLVHL